jgi:ribosome modulation factor
MRHFKKGTHASAGRPKRRSPALRRRRQSDSASSAESRAVPAHPAEAPPPTPAHTRRFTDRSDPVQRAFEDGLEQGRRDASPGECPFKDEPLRSAWLEGCVQGRFGIKLADRSALDVDRSNPRPSLRAKTTLVCTVCEQIWSESDARNEPREKGLFGAARYAWCASCRRKVDQPWSEEYRKRWDRFASNNPRHR